MSFNLCVHEAVSLWTTLTSIHHLYVHRCSCPYLHLASQSLNWIRDTRRICPRFQRVMAAWGADSYWSIIRGVCRIHYTPDHCLEDYTFFTGTWPLTMVKVSISRFSHLHPNFESAISLSCWWPHLISLEHVLLSPPTWISTPPMPPASSLRSRPKSLSALL